MGAVTWAIGTGVGTVLENTVWGAALAESSAIEFNAVSGAIGGGIVGEISGEGFAKGAKFGAISRAISGGVNKYLGEYANKSIFNKLLPEALKEV